MNEKPFALLVTPVLPMPGGSGSAIRAWNWLQELSRDYRVHLIVPGVSPVEADIPEDYPVQAIWPLAAPPSALRRTFRATGLLLPFLVLFSARFVTDWQRLDSASSLHALKDRLSNGAVLRIVIFRLQMQELGLRLTKLFPDAPVELDLDDLESSTRASVAGASWRMGHYMQAARHLSAAVQYALLQRRLPNLYRSIYLAAENDLGQMPQRLAPILACRPNRIPMPRHQPPMAPLRDLGLLFVGTLDYPPNEEAVRYLIESLVPMLAARLAMPWRLRIIGRHASPAMRQLLKNRPHVEFLSNLEDLSKGYEMAHIVLVPLQAGGGTKLKTLEGFAYRKPVISTCHGVRGLTAVPGEHYLQADNAEEFVDSIIVLATQRERAERIAAAGWALFQKSYQTP